MRACEGRRLPVHKASQVVSEQVKPRLYLGLYITYNEQIQRRPVPHAAFVNEVRRDRAGNRWPATTRARLEPATHTWRGGGSNWGAGILSVAVVYCRVLELS